MRRIGLLALFVVLGSLVMAPGARAAVPVVVVEGQGWGHGVGMAQDGAYWMGVDGATMDQILDHFYPGTGRGSNTGTVRVLLLVAPEGRAQLTFPQGGEVRSPRSGPQRPGFPVQLEPGGSVQITHSGGTYRVEPTGGVRAAGAAGPAQVVQLPGTGSPSSTTSTTAPSLIPTVPEQPTTTTTAPATTTTTAPGASPGTTQPPAPGVSSPEPVWAGPTSGGGTVGVPARGFSYRGEVEVSAAGGPLRVVNEIDIEQYLWGLAEVGGSYPPAALQAQVVAARTYALRAMAANGEICDTQRCQVYKGASGEFRAQIDAVNATLGTTLTFGSAFASAVFSANAAGVSATPEEGFGTPNANHPYLVATRYTTRSPDPWEVRIGLADLARRLKYVGTATAVKVTKTGPSGRALEVTVDGNAGRLVVPALEADRAMGLRSTMWTLRMTTADAAPVAPEAAELIQAQPEDVGKVIAEETAAAVLRSTSSDRVTTTTTILYAAPVSRRGSSHGTVPWLLTVVVLGAGVVGMATLRRTALVDQASRPPDGPATSVKGRRRREPLRPE